MKRLRTGVVLINRRRLLNIETLQNDALHICTVNFKMKWKKNQRNSNLILSFHIFLVVETDFISCKNFMILSPYSCKCKEKRDRRKKNDGKRLACWASFICKVFLRVYLTFAKSIWFIKLRRKLHAYEWMRMKCTDCALHF